MIKHLIFLCTISFSVLSIHAQQSDFTYSLSSSTGINIGKIPSDIISRSNYDIQSDIRPTFSFGGNISCRINNRINLSSGLSYNYLQTKFTYTNTISNSVIIIEPGNVFEEVVNSYNIDYIYSSTYHGLVVPLEVNLYTKNRKSAFKLGVQFLSIFSESYSNDLALLRASINPPTLTIERVEQNGIAEHTTKELGVRLGYSKFIHRKLSIDFLTYAGLFRVIEFENSLSVRERLNQQLTLGLTYHFKGNN